MPRGKRIVFAGFCSVDGFPVATMRFHKQDKLGKSWKDHVQGMEKYCPTCKKKSPVKFKEQKHSSN